MAPRKLIQGTKTHPSILVHVCTQDGTELGTITVESKKELANTAAVDWRPIIIDGDVRSFRYLGYRLDPPNGDGEVVGYLWVSESVWKK